jgi:hypothetical protein
MDEDHQNQQVNQEAASERDSDQQCMKPTVIGWISIFLRPMLKRLIYQIIVDGDRERKWLPERMRCVSRQILFNGYEHDIFGTESADSTVDSRFQMF